MMLVYRWIFTAKMGRIEEALALCLAEMKRIDYPHAYRILTTDIGSMDTLILETECESLAEHKEFWAEWSASPESRPFWKKWTDVQQGRTSELWTLAE